MKYVIMVSHGELAQDYIQQLKWWLEIVNDVLSTSLKDGMSADEFADNFRTLVKDITVEDEIILLADISSSGSPFTNAF